MSYSFILIIPRSILGFSVRKIFLFFQKIHWQDKHSEGNKNFSAWILFFC